MFKLLALNGVRLGTLGTDVSPGVCLIYKLQFQHFSEIEYRYE
jgi:hypothetical protein